MSHLVTLVSYVHTRRKKEGDLPAKEFLERYPVLRNDRVRFGFFGIEIEGEVYVFGTNSSLRDVLENKPCSGQVTRYTDLIREVEKTPQGVIRHTISSESFDPAVVLGDYGDKHSLGFQLNPTSNWFYNSVLYVRNRAGLRELPNTNSISEVVAFLENKK